MRYAIIILWHVFMILEISIRQYHFYNKRATLFVCLWIKLNSEFLVELSEVLNKIQIVEKLKLRVNFLRIMSITCLKGKSLPPLNWWVKWNQLSSWDFQHRIFICHSIIWSVKSIEKERKKVKTTNIHFIHQKGVILSVIKTIGKLKPSQCRKIS